MYKLPVYGSQRKAKIDRDRLEVLRKIPPDELFFVRDLPEDLEQKARTWCVGGITALTGVSAQKWSQVVLERYIEPTINAIRNGKTHVCAFKDADVAQNVYSRISHWMSQRGMQCCCVKTRYPNGGVRMEFYPTREERDAAEKRLRDKNPKDKR